MSNVYKLWSSEASSNVVGCVGHHERALELNCITTRRSALPVRMSYKVNVRSEPILASTLGSLWLNRTEVIVSVDVGNVRLDIAEVLCCTGQNKLKSTMMQYGLTLIRPIFE